ncbi:histidinol-phosphate transaminase [Elusimicrobiota bacterium]
MSEIINSRILELDPYSIPEVAEEEIKLDAQENPYPLPPNIKNKIIEKISRTDLNRYPDHKYERIRELIAEYSNTSSENILLGNGSDELILNILTACGGIGKIACAPTPTFAMYKILSQVTGTEFVSIPMEEGFVLPVNKILAVRPDVIFIAYPNNPTANCFDQEAVLKIIDNCKGLIVIDEAYYEFSGKTFADKINESSKVVILRTFSKAFSLAGIRAGYMLARKELINEFRKVQLPYNINIITQLTLEVVLANRLQALDSVKVLLKSRDAVFGELSQMEGIRAFPSEANYILMKIDRIDDVMKALDKSGIRVREFSNTELKGYLRLTIGTEEENEHFYNTILSALS